MISWIVSIYYNIKYQQQIPGLDLRIIDSILELWLVVKYCLLIIFISKSCNEK